MTPVRVALAILTSTMSASVACRSNARPANAVANADTALVVALKRGACFGRCPEYRVALFENGRVEFAGTKNVALVGDAVGLARTTDVRALKGLISESGFAELDTAFVHGSAGCGQYFTDLPMIVLSARVGSGVKQVHYDPGCQGAPRFLGTIAALVDSVTGTATWIEGKREGIR